MSKRIKYIGFVKGNNLLLGDDDIDIRKGTLVFIWKNNKEWSFCESLSYVGNVEKSWNKETLLEVNHVIERVTKFKCKNIAIFKLLY